MQAIFHARIHDALTMAHSTRDGSDEGSAAASATATATATASCARHTYGSAPACQWHAYVLTISPQAIVHAHLFYVRAGRLLASRGLLVCPRGPELLVLVPSGMHDTRGMQTLLSWLHALLPSPPAFAKRLKGSSSTSWSLLLRADDPTGEAQRQLAPRQRIQLAGIDEVWQVEIQMMSAASAPEGVADATLQACLFHAVSLELNRQGWSMVAGRFVRIPSGCTPAPSVPAVQLVLTLTQQSELTTFINVAHVKFNAISVNVKGRDATQINFSEQIVRVLPELTEAMIVQTTGVADLSNSASLGIDREAWAEKHGIALPAAFPVVQVKMGVDDAFGQFPTATYPLCCCLTSPLHPVVTRSKDEAAQHKLQQEQQAVVQEVLTILKSLRCIAPSGGALTPLLHHFEQHECGALLQAINPFQSVKASSAAATQFIPSDMGFQKASSIIDATVAAGARAAASGATPAASGKRKLIKLTIPPSRHKSGNDDGLSLSYVKQQTQVAAPSLTLSSFSNPFFANDTPTASRVKGALPSTFSGSADDERRRHPADVPAEDEKPPPAKKAKKAATSAAAAAAPPSSSATKLKLKHGKESEQQRAARKEREKAEKAAAKSAAKAASKAGKGSAGGRSARSSTAPAAAASVWGAEFAAVLRAELTGETLPTTAATNTAADFQRAMGGGAATAAPVQGASARPTPTPPADKLRMPEASKAKSSSKSTNAKSSKKPAASKQAKLTFTVV